MATKEEPPWQRSARNVAELLQELRVAQAGVQILFGFLLAVTFTDRYARSNAFVHTLHLTAVMLAVAASALLTAPAAWHRLLFRHRRRGELLNSANAMALAGLGCLAGAMTATVVLLVYVVAGAGWATVIGTLVGVLFALLWFILPLRQRRPRGQPPAY